MDGLKVKVNVNDIIDIYEKEVSVNTKNKSKVYNFEKNKIENNRLEDDIKAGENGSGFKTIDF